MEDLIWYAVAGGAIAMLAVGIGFVRGYRKGSK